MKLVSTSIQPTVSVVIPAFNAATTLRSTLNTVFSQSRPALEVIVVDDGSSDGTAALLLDLIEEHPNLRVITQDNSGLAVARRNGVSAARGDLIALMDADDLCHPERLALQVQLLSEHPELALCSSDFSAFDSEGPVATSFGARYYSIIGNSAQGLGSLYSHRTKLNILGRGQSAPPKPDSILAYTGNVYAHMVHGNFVHPPTVMFRRELLGQIGNFDPEARSMCDWDWLTQASKVGTFGHIDFPLLDYRLSPTQMSSRKHGIRSSNDTLHVAQRICRRDPALFRKDKARFRKELFGYGMDAADACAESNKRDALNHLLRGCLQGGRVSERTLRILFKVLAPNRLVNSVRTWRSSLPRTATP